VDEGTIVLFSVLAQPPGGRALGDFLADRVSGPSSVYQVLGVIQSNFLDHGRVRRFLYGRSMSGR
jgi:hypothetical protein